MNFTYAQKNWKPIAAVVAVGVASFTGYTIGDDNAAVEKYKAEAVKAHEATEQAEQKTKQLEAQSEAAQVAQHEAEKEMAKWKAYAEAWEAWSKQDPGCWMDFNVPGFHFKAKCNNPHVPQLG